MMTYIVTCKLFGEYHEADNEWDVEDGKKEVEANSEQDAIAKAQKTIGLYVMECVRK
jgi:hypothetical protein